tara:strand:+ start:173 stop:1108 length:936 start_codon:yes stop_codon:yes gene_type:complete
MKVFLLILVLLTFGVGLACDRDEENKSEELPPIYLQKWDPTSTPRPEPTRTPMPTPTPTFTPTPSPTPIPTLTPTFTPTPIVMLPKFELEVADVLEGTIASMGNVTSYRYLLEGAAHLDAGGIKISVPLEAAGIVENNNSTALFATSLMGLSFSFATFQNDNRIFIKDPVSEYWLENSNFAVGLIPPMFWRGEGAQILSLPYEVQEVSSDGELGLSVSQKIADLTTIGLLGGGEDAHFYEVANVNISIIVDENDLRIAHIDAQFTIIEGGLFASETLGLPGLSGLGEAEVVVTVSFSDYDLIFDLTVPEIS